MITRTFVKQLGQARPAGTTAATLYTKVQNATVYLDQIFICNTTGSAATYRIFFHDDGSTYTTGNALWYDVSLAPNTTDKHDLKIGMDTDGGTVGVRSGTGNALTFSLFGEEAPV